MASHVRGGQGIVRNQIDVNPCPTRPKPYLIKYLKSAVVISVLNKWLYVFLSVFSSIKGLYDALKNDEVDGILMDRFLGAYFLDIMNETRFKVFKSFQVEIPYYIAMPYSETTRGIMDTGSCVKTQIDNADLDDFLIRYLKPVQVKHTNIS